MRPISPLAAIFCFVSCFACESFSGEINVRHGQDRARPAATDLNRAQCPVTGGPVDSSVYLTEQGGRVFFATKDAVSEYRRNRRDFADLAAVQLVVTSQAEQFRCPATRREFSRDFSLMIEGVEVYFASEEARQKFAEHSEDERRAKVFDPAVFRKSFRKVAGHPVAQRKPARDSSRQNHPAQESPEQLTDADAKRALQRLAGPMQAQDRNLHKLMIIDEFVGSGVGFDDNGQPAIFAMVETKAAVKGLPSRLDGIPVIPEVVGKLYAEANAEGTLKAVSSTAQAPNTRFERPTPIGVSTGVTYTKSGCVSGTIGCRLTGILNGEPALFALSCNHVFAGQNRAPLQSRILQPGLSDTKCVVDTVNNGLGLLERYQVIQFAGLANRIDAAIVVVDAETLSNSTPPDDGYGVPGSNPVAAVPGQWVKKYGRTTRLTYGRVSKINSTVYITYSSGTAMYTGQIVAVPRESSSGFAVAGDSGSLLVSDPEQAPVGLVFASSPNGSMAVCNPIEEVLNAFSSYSVSIDGTP